MLTTAWYSSFLSAFNSTCVFGYCSEWRMMSEVFCSRRTSALGSPILAVSGPAASKKNDKIFKITYQSWAWGNALSPCPSLKHCTEESCQGPGSSWDFYSPGHIQLKLWLPFPSPVAPFCHLCWAGLSKSPAETAVVLATEQGSDQGRKALTKQQSLFLSAFGNTPFGNFIWLCVCVLRVCTINKKVLTFIRASFALSWILTNSKAVSPLCWL